MLRRLDSDIYFPGDPDFDFEFVSKYLIFPSLDENDFSCTVMYSMQQKQCTTALNEKTRVFLGQFF